MWIFSRGTFNSSAAIWESIVLHPWPISTVPARIVTSPLPLISTAAVDVLGERVGLEMQARPRPTVLDRGLSQPMASAALCKVSFSPTLWSRSPQ